MKSREQEQREMIFIIIVAILFFFACSVLSSCSTKPKPIEEPEIIAQPYDDPNPILPKPDIIKNPPVMTKKPFEERSYPSKGWIPDYDEYIKSLVTERMLNQPNSRMAKFCDVWSKLSIDEKKQMYVDLLYSIAFPESNYNNLTIYLESTMSNDDLTGLPTMSEGLFQLSYQDRRSYGPECAFDWKKDYTKLKDDIKNKRKISKYPERDTLNPWKNIKCAVKIIDTQLKISSKEFADSLGSYWYVMQRRHSDEYRQVWKKMRERNTPCD